MAFVLTPLQTSEISQWLDIQFAAFGSSTTSFTPAIFPNGLTPELRTYLIEKLEKGLNENPSGHSYFIRDSVTNTPVGIVRWTIQSEDKTEEQLNEESEKFQKQNAEEPEVNGMYREGWSRFLQIQNKIHREIMQGKKHVYLSILAIHPDHQRKGAGIAGLQWGTDKADELDLPAYLESSVMGKGLYEKFGFSFVKMFPFNPREDLGIPHDAPHYCMKRTATVKKDETNASSV